MEVDSKSSSFPLCHIKLGKIIVVGTVLKVRLISFLCLEAIHA